MPLTHYLHNRGTGLGPLSIPSLEKTLRSCNDGSKGRLPVLKTQVIAPASTLTTARKELSESCGKSRENISKNLRSDGCLGQIQAPPFIVPFLPLSPSCARRVPITGPWRIPLFIARDECAARSRPG